MTLTVPQPPRERIQLLGVPLDRLTVPEAVAHIDDALAGGRGGWVVTPNLDILRRLVNDPELAALCDGADVRLADGMPLVWASRLQGTPLTERAAGSDLVVELAERAAASGRSLFLLGGSAGVADQAAQVLTSRFPGLTVSGTACPPLGFEDDAAYVAALDARLVAAAPDIVYVALGCPKQEHLIRRLRTLLPSTWFLGIGISLSFITGDVARAPRFVRMIGLEWVHRLVQEPRRLARRYLLHGLPFALRLFASAAATRFRPRP